MVHRIYRTTFQLRTLLLAMALAACANCATADESIQFNQHIRPILSRHCIACHGPDEDDRQADLRLDTYAGSVEDLGGYAAIAPGKPDQSELIARLLTDDPDLRMPPADHAEALKPEEIELLTKWIEQGAEYEEHWSFVPPQKPQIPRQLQGNDSAVIDHFMAIKLAEAGLTRNTSASPRMLVRRVCLDLTGIPPVAQSESVSLAIKAYLGDASEVRFGALVDALMQSPAFAEHWASIWLDLARYADTVGYSGDETRDIWPWRDWLIHALYTNKSYKEMSIEMLAGDMLPEASDEQRLATGFHRNTLSNNEGGTQDEEFRTIAVKDRLSTTMNAWMGLTVRCAECHSHKYDPISQAEYYQLLDFFNQTADADRRDDSPKLAVVPRRDPEELAELNSRIEQLKEKVAAAPKVWQVRQPAKMASRAGTQFKLLEDNSILAKGPNPDVETYEITFPLKAGESVTGIRLEAIPHLSNDGKVGRSGEGGFILSQIRMARHDDIEPSEIREDNGTGLFFADAENDFNSPNNHASTAIKKEVGSKEHQQGWAVRHPISGYKDHREAVFELEQPLQADANTLVTVYLRHDAPWIRLNLGCFRIATCSASKPAQQYRDQTLDPARRRLAILKSQADERIRVPVLAQLPDAKLRETFVNLRGNYLSLGEKVQANFPEAFAPSHPNHEYALNRLGLAEWLFDDENPLTARVAVNRYWARLMGMGIVETEEDFGTQGTPPSHPQLMDFLAVKFVENKWDVRWLLKTIATSETYQQSQLASSAALKMDPRNQLLSRGPRIRLTAEVVRDQALAVSGLLTQKMYGPPVYPPSPIKRVVNAFTGGMTWQESQGEDRYRRAIYTFLKRSSPHPLFETFDMASRDICSLRRLRTNTPLQSFMTLNDITFIEAARALAERMLADGRSIDQALAFGLEQVLFVESAETHQLEVLGSLYHQCVEKYDVNPAAAAKLLGLPAKTQEFDAAAKASLSQHAAMTVVANVILNLDGFLNN